MSARGTSTPQADLRHGRLPYRPALDGLRGLAVATVVGYHLRPSAVPGGFVGVDVFFVLSGFLITSLLLAETESTSAIQWGRFVVRRVRRLAPAMLLMMAALAIYGATWANPFELQRLRTHGVWTLLSLANWRFILDGVTYTDVVVGASPLRHMWSLAIEEQFYVVLPLAIFAASRFVARQLRRKVLFTAIVLALGSAGWAAWLSVTGAETARTYFGTDTRAQALLVGVALGAALSGRALNDSARKVARASALGGVFILGAFTLVVREQSTFLPRGGFALAAVASAMVIAGAEHLSPLRAVLTSKGLVALGTISYGVYLWHWPIIVIIDSRRTGLDAGSLPLAALQAGLTLATAALSYRVLELPIRSGVLGQRLGRVGATIMWPVATGAVMLGLVVATAPPALDAAPPSVTATSGSTSQTQADASNPVRMAILGDSVAHSLAGGEILDFPNVAPWNADQATVEDMTSLARPGCSFLPGTVTPDEGRTEADLSSFCGDWRADLADGLSAHRSTHLVVLPVNDMNDRMVDGKLVTFGSDEFVRILDEWLRELQTIATDHGTNLVLVAPASRPPEYADPYVGERAPALLQLLRDYGLAHDVLTLSLADAPTTQRFDGTHYAPPEGRDVLTWVRNQIESDARPLPIA